MFIFVILSMLFYFGATETVRVRANVHCGMHKTAGTPEMFLMESDFGEVPILSWFDSDDILDETKVDYGEPFNLDGSEIEMFSLEPYLLIRHRCFDIEREDIVDLSRHHIAADGMYHLGDIVLKHTGYVIRPFGKK